jgi:hypothetical protein
MIQKPATARTAVQNRGALASPIPLMVLHLPSDMCSSGKLSMKLEGFLTDSEWFHKGNRLRRFPSSTSALKV